MLLSTLCSAIASLSLQSPLAASLNDCIAGYGVDSDCSRVAIAGCDNSVRLVYLDESKPVRILGRYSDRIYSIEFSPDGGRLVTACMDGRARVFDLGRGEEMASLAAYPGGGSCKWTGAVAAFSRDGERLLTYGYSHQAVLWNLAEKRPIRNLGDDTGIVEHAKWSPDSTLIATATDQRVVRVWDGKTGEPRSDPMGMGPPIYGLSFDGTGSRLAVGGGDAKARVIDVAKRTIALTLSHEDQNWFGDLGVYADRFSRDGKHLLTTSFSFHEVRSWDTATGKEEWRSDFDGGNEGGICATYSPDESFVFVSRRARMIDAKTGAMIRQLPDSCIVSYTLSPDGKHVLGIENGALVVRGAETLEVLWTIAFTGSDQVSVRKAPPRDPSKR